MIDDESTEDKRAIRDEWKRRLLNEMAEVEGVSTRKSAGRGRRNVAQLQSSLNDELQAVADERGQTVEELLAENRKFHDQIVSFMSRAGINVSSAVGAIKLARAAKDQRQGASSGGRARASAYDHNYQAALESKLYAYPRWSVTQARREVATEFSVSLRTVERRTVNPRK